MNYMKFTLLSHDHVTEVPVAIGTYALKNYKLRVFAALD